MDFWRDQIVRATELANTSEGTNELLVFYAQLLRAQRAVYEFLNQQDWVPTGELERDIFIFRSTFPMILRTVEEAGPEQLVERARSLKSAEAIDEMLFEYWREPSDTEFFAKAFLQPYGLYVSATTAQPLKGIDEKRCPACDGKPQLSFLQNQETTAESGNRDLMCAKCLYVWSFRRVVCANCGEENPAQLAYFQSTTLNHVRIEACDTCKHYLKSVDLTRLGNAQPLVDEVAAAPLDLWATEHGYTKIEINLIGF